VDYLTGGPLLRARKIEEIAVYLIWASLDVL